MGKFNEGYSNLFGTQTWEDEGGDETDPEDGQRNETGDINYVWMSVVSAVSDTTKLAWPEVYSMGIVEFLNIFGFIRDRAEREKRQREQYLRNARRN